MKVVVLNTGFLAQDSQFIATAVQRQAHDVANIRARPPRRAFTQESPTQSNSAGSQRNRNSSGASSRPIHDGLS